MSLNVQGSQLYFLDPDSSVDDILEVGCVINLSGLNAPREDVDGTCIADTARRIEVGMPVPAPVNMTIRFDLNDDVHARMLELFQAGTEIKWALGLSDGTVAPTTVDSSGDIVLPAARSWITFPGALKDFPWDFPIGQKVTNAVVIQPSELYVLTPQ